MGMALLGPRTTSDAQEEESPLAGDSCASRTEVQGKAMSLEDLELSDQELISGLHHSFLGGRVIGKVPCSSVPTVSSFCANVQVRVHISYN